MVGVGLVDLGWWARKMGALIRKVAGNRAHSRGGAERRRQGRQRPVRLPVTADRETTLDDPKVDAVILATRTASMASMVRQSVAARKHVFCERPLALTRKEGSLRSTSTNRRTSCSVWATNVALSLRLLAKRSILSPATSWESTSAA
jgi:predicted dehydrogenase